MLQISIGYQVLAEACGPEITERLMLPTVLNLAGDGVPNVRFNIAKCLTIIGPKLNSSCQTSQVKPCINKLCDDSDFDVRYFASEAFLGKLDQTLKYWSIKISLLICQNKLDYTVANWPITVS